MRPHDTYHVAFKCLLERALQLPPRQKPSRRKLELCYELDNDGHNANEEKAKSLKDKLASPLKHLCKVDIAYTPWLSRKMRLRKPSLRPSAQDRGVAPIVARHMNVCMYGSDRRGP